MNDNFKLVEIKSEPGVVTSMPDNPDKYKVTKDLLNEWIVSHRLKGELSPRIILDDGTKVSVQCSSVHYCEPASDNALEYTKVEFDCDRDKVPDYMSEYEMGKSGIYAYVPMELLVRWMSEVASKTNLSPINKFKQIENSAFIKS